MVKRYNKFKRLIDLAVDFLDSCLDFEDLEFIQSKLSLIANEFFKVNGLKFNFNISFADCPLLGRMGNVEGNEIVFNKTRIETFLYFKLDCFDKNHIDKLNNLYSNFNNNLKLNKYEKCLKSFIEKYKSLGLDDYFFQMGSYKTLKYEMLDILFHELEHIMQESVSYNKENCDLILLFSWVFNKQYNALINKNVKISYNRENYIFPIEFDSRYFSFLMLSLINNKIKDSLFKKYIDTSIIIPKNLAIGETAKKIYADFILVSNLYKENFDDSFSEDVQKIINNKKNLIEAFIQRYTEMMQYRENVYGKKI